MAKYSDYDIQAVKDAIDLRDIVARDTGKKWRGERWLVNSPLRDDRHPSFIVSHDFAYDLASCDRYDIFDYMQEMHNISFREFMESHAPKDLRKLKKQPKKKKEVWEPFVSPFNAKQYAKRFGKHKAKSLPYMKERGFDVDDLKRWKIGYAYMPNWYHLGDGKRLKSIVGRISIPYYIGTDVHSVTLRLDEADVARRLEGNRAQLDLVIEDLQKKEAKRKAEGKPYKEVTERMAIEALYGARYKHWRVKSGEEYITSKPTIFNGETLLKQVDVNEYDFARDNHVIDLVIDEGAINAMTAVKNGVPAIASKDYLWTNMERICERVLRIIVFIHNDDEFEMNNGRKFIPGESYWQKLQGELGKHRVLGLHIPKDYSDINEFWVKDPKGFERFLDKHNIQRNWEHCKA